MFTCAGTPTRDEKKKEGKGKECCIRTEGSEGKFVMAEGTFVVLNDGQAGYFVFCLCTESHEHFVVVII